MLTNWRLIKISRAPISLLFLLILVATTILSARSSFAHEGIRDGSKWEGGRCNTGTIDFDPFLKLKDVYWDPNNPTCIAYISAVGIAMKATEIAVKKVACKPTPVNVDAVAIDTTETLADAATTVTPPSVPGPSSTVSIVKLGAKCVARTVLTTATCASKPPLCTIATADTTRCCIGVAGYVVAHGVAVAALAVIWDVARIAYESGRVCGHDWNEWNIQEATKADGTTEIVSKKVSGAYRRYLEATYGAKGTGSKLITNQGYREFIYGGREYVDNGDGACDNPPNFSKYLGYDSSGKQRYYMTGPGVAPVYACGRFLTENHTAEEAVAYACCKARSQNTICIESKKGLGGTLSDYDYKFCKMGELCSLQNVTFDIYESRRQPNHICAKTFSVCPYNHPLGGGTEEVTPTCQFMNHCSKIPIQPYVRTGDDFDGDFISATCRNMKGDSQNVYGYNSDLIPVSMKGFSAPMVQCFKETMENVFLNKAGDTRCTDPKEVATKDGVCASGNYDYKKGEDLKTKSFFLKVQDSLQTVIKVALTFSVIGIGISILFAVNSTYLSKKVLMSYILKVALVMYFAAGDGWQSGFMKGVMDSSGLLADMAFKVDESAPANKLDGCQFPRFNYADPSEDTKYSEDKLAYPPGKEYLRIWDTLDCKIALALGFGPSVSVPNLVMLILGGFFTGGLGIIFFVATFFFAFCLIAIAVRAMHIFLMCITAMVLLMYVSPITITLSMFERTKGIFQQWWKKLLGVTLQPMILFAYLAVLISLLDAAIIGPDATFSGDGQRGPKAINCAGAAADTSIYCIFVGTDNLSQYSGLKTLGIGIPMITGLNATKLNTIIKAAFMLFIFMAFLEKISSVAGKLVGSDLDSNWSGASASGMMKKVGGALQTMQKRGMGATRKATGAVARKGGEIARKLGDQGKSVEGAQEAKGGDAVAKSDQDVKGGDAAAKSDQDAKGAEAVTKDGEGAKGDGAKNPEGNATADGAKTNPEDKSTADGAKDPAASGSSGGGSEGGDGKAESASTPPAEQKAESASTPPAEQKAESASTPPPSANPEGNAKADGAKGGGSEGGGEKAASEQAPTPAAEAPKAEDPAASDSSGEGAKAAEGNNAATEQPAPPPASDSGGDSPDQGAVSSSTQPPAEQKSESASTSPTDSAPPAAASDSSSAGESAKVADSASEPAPTPASEPTPPPQSPPPPAASAQSGSSASSAPAAAATPSAPAAQGSKGSGGAKKPVKSSGYGNQPKGGGAKKSSAGGGGSKKTAAPEQAKPHHEGLHRKSKDTGDAHGKVDRHSGAKAKVDSNNHPPPKASPKK